LQSQRTKNVVKYHWEKELDHDGRIFKVNIREYFIGSLCETHDREYFLASVVTRKTVVPFGAVVFHSVASLSLLTFLACIHTISS